MRGFVLSRFHLTGEEAAENAARSQRQSQTAISLKPTPDRHQPEARQQKAKQQKARQQKARDVETFRAFALISSQMRSRAHLSMLAEVRLRAILRNFRSLRILRPLWPFRTLGATLCSLGHIL